MPTRAALHSSMETAVVTATVSTTYSFILNLLVSLLREEYGLLSGFKDELEKLQSIFTRIECVLDDAMTRQLKDRALQDWLVKLTDLACHAEDVLDKFNFEVTRRNAASGEGCLREVRDFFSRNNQLKFRFLMAHKIKDLRGEMDSFAEEVSKFNLGQGASERLFRNNDERVTHSYVISSDVVGREEEKEKVVAMLLNDVTSRYVSVIAIVGVGGIGKTTLVQLAYNDRRRVHEHFDLKIWVCVSDDFVLSRLLKSLIGSAKKKKCEIDELDQLQIKTREVVQGKKFLLVLDDVWNEEPQKWEKLEILLRSGARGSKVVVTTRSLKVASIVHSSQNLLLSPLPDNLCWELFQRRAFNAETTPGENFVAIGKEIVKKCGGNPLAAQALGSLLHFKHELSDWTTVLDSEMWQLFDSQSGEIMPILRLSYDHLSPQAKQCFLFCCLFPKDYELEKKTLIQQWLSNGFVLDEQVAREVFNDLCWRSFFVEAKKNEDGQIVDCKLHDLMHDLARSVAGKHFCMITREIKDGAIDKRTYHLLIDQWPSHLAMLEETKKAESLRTLLISRYYPIEENFLGRIFGTLRSLRVLDFSSSGIKVIPDSVGSLTHLRYLNLSNNPTELLPESIGYLLNLQVLKLSNTKLKKLPKSFRKLQSLRHLDIRRCQVLTNMPVGVGRLANLQTLTDFIVSTEKSSCGLEELKELNLSGELFIWHLENFKMETTGIEQMILSSKENLVSLRLTWDHRNNATSNNEHERALDMLRPHLNLKRLLLHNYNGLTFPPWLSESLLPNLVEVKLMCCRNCEHLPSFGNIASLKDLQIIGMHQVRQINGEFYGTGPVKGFPALERLAFSDMPNLEEWYVLEGMPFPQLIMLTISKCGALISIPWVESIQKLDLSDCSSSLVASLSNKPDLPVLSSLIINSMQGLTSLPDGSLLGLNSLKKLLVSSCKQLECLPLKDMEQLVALQSLEIADCPELNSLAFSAMQLTCLQNLNIRNCINLNSLPQDWTSIASMRSMHVVGCRNIASSSWTELEIKGLSSLSDFSIEICNDKVNLSSSLQHLTNLRTLIVHGGHDKLHPQPSKLIMGNYLIICCCSDLGSILDGLSNATSLEDLQLKCISCATLPDSIGEIQSLQYLSIHDSSELTSLPNSLRGLSKLEGLWICGCPRLEGRCQRNTGEDWSIISHINTVGIGSGKLTQDGA